MLFLDLGPNCFSVEHSHDGSNTSQEAPGISLAYNCQQYGHGYKTPCLPHWTGGSHYGEAHIGAGLLQRLCWLKKQTQKKRSRLQDGERRLLGWTCLFSPHPHIPQTSRAGVFTPQPTHFTESKSEGSREFQNQTYFLVKHKIHLSLLQYDQRDTIIFLSHLGSQMSQT